MSVTSRQLFEELIISCDLINLFTGRSLKRDVVIGRASEGPFSRIPVQRLSSDNNYWINLKSCHLFTVVSQGINILKKFASELPFVIFSAHHLYPVDNYSVRKELGPICLLFHTERDFFQGYLLSQNWIKAFRSTGIARPKNRLYQISRYLTSWLRVLASSFVSWGRKKPFLKPLYLNLYFKDYIGTFWEFTVFGQISKFLLVSSSHDGDQTFAQYLEECSYWCEGFVMDICHFFIGLILFLWRRLISMLASWQPFSFMALIFGVFLACGLREMLGNCIVILKPCWVPFFLRRLFVKKSIKI